MKQPLTAVLQKKHALQQFAGGRWHSHAHVFVFVTGVILALLIFGFSSLFVQKMLDQEQERITQQFLYYYLDELDEKRATVDEIYDYLNVAYPQKTVSNLLPARVLQEAKLFENFDFVALYFTRNQKNYVYPLRRVQGSLPGIVAADQAYQNILGPFLSHERLIDDKPQLFTDQETLSRISALATENRFPFVYAKNAPLAFAPDAVLVAVGDLKNVWGKSALYDGVSLAEINFSHGSSPTPFYSYLNNYADEAGGLFKKQAHEFAFGDLNWTIVTQFYRQDLVAFVTGFPLLVALLVLIGAGVMAVYVYRETRQSVQATQMNSALESKNEALQEEIDKRATLYKDLKKSERENKILIDSISDIIFEVNVKGELTYVNASWPRITGFSIMQAMDKNLFSLLHPQDQAREKKSFELLVSGQKSSYRSFTRLRNADGSFRAVELSISMVHRHTDGDIRVVGAITDVEDRRRAEQALGEAEKRYRAIVENAAWGIYQMTPEGIYLSVNHALVDALGYSDTEDMLNHISNAHEQVYGDARERLLFLREVDMRGAVNYSETQVVTKSGQRIWVSENIRAVKDSNGTILYYEGSLEDITDRKQSDLLLREAKVQSDMASRAKSEFLANMSHELRTPLNAIIGFSDILIKESFGPLGHESYHDYVEDIHKSGKHLMTIINEILEISRIEVRERDLNEEIIDLGDVMESCLQLMKNKMQSNQIESLNMLGNMPKVVVEERAFKQIFANILSNAVKFTPRGGRITLHSDVLATGELSVSITDTGIGLEPEQIKKALSPFGQVANDFDKENSGTGLGLTIVKALVELHDAKLEIFSQKGVGTTVSVRLPAKRVRLNEPEDKEYSAEEDAQSLPDEFA